MNNRIYIGADHAGHDLKKALLAYFEKKNRPLIDCGSYNDMPSNYADIGHEVALKIQADEGCRGILICGTGIGMSIAANRHHGIRAALCHNLFTAESSRAHNDANIIVLGSRVVDESLAKECIETFLKTPFDGGRHKERVQHIDRSA